MLTQMGLVAAGGRKGSSRKGASPPSRRKTPASPPPPVSGDEGSLVLDEFDQEAPELRNAPIETSRYHPVAMTRQPPVLQSQQLRQRIEEVAAQVVATQKQAGEGC